MGSNIEVGRLGKDSWQVFIQNKRTATDFECMPYTGETFDIDDVAVPYCPAIDMHSKRKDTTALAGGASQDLNDLYINTQWPHGASFMHLRENGHRLKRLNLCRKRQCMEILILTRSSVWCARSYGRHRV